MFVTFSNAPLDLTDYEPIESPRLLAALVSSLNTALNCPQGNVYIVCAHSAQPGEHEGGLECWCQPDEFVFGVQPFVSHA
jgi:hypothetical protein